MRLTYQSAGAKWAVAMAGDRQEIEYQFNSFYNHRATDEKQPIWLSDKFAYIWTTPEKLLYALKRAELCKILNNKELKGGKAKKVARQRGEKRFKELPTETFISTNKLGDGFYSLAEIFHEID